MSEEKQLHIQAIEPLMHSLPLPTVCIDLAGKVIMWNPASEALFGWSRDEVLGKAYPLISEEGVDEVFEIYNNLMESSKTMDTDSIRRTKTGERLHLSISKAPLMDEGGRVSGALIAFHDITDRKQVDDQRRTLNAVLMQRTNQLARVVEELRSANEKLAAHDKRRSEFLAVISHELRTPLATIQGSADNLIERSPRSDDDLRLLRIMTRNILRLSRLIEHLLDLSRVDSGHFSIRLTEIDLRGPIMMVVEGYQSLEKKLGKTLTLEISDGSFKALADHDRVVQVATNLIDNALRFAESAVRVEMSERNDEILLTIENDGPVIDDEDLPLLFERFTSLKSGGHKSQIGLGLSIVKAIVDGHGGSIMAERIGGCHSATLQHRNSNAGDVAMLQSDTGMRFSIRFPRYAAEQAT